MVGPLLGASPAKPLPPELESIMQQAGERGVVYARSAQGYTGCKGRVIGPRRKVVTLGRPAP